MVRGGSANWSVSVIACGEPSNPRTFSGYSRHLCDALRSHGTLRREFSAKLLRAVDVMTGAVHLMQKPTGYGIGVRRQWLWSDRGNRALTRRLDAVLRRSGDRGVFLQVGTLVTVERDIGPHVVLTDMTIPQASRARQFSIGEFSGPQLNEAIEIQRRVLENARHVFTLSQWTADSIVQDFGVPAERVTVVYAGSNLILPAGVSVERAPREILFVGIDWKRKGGPLLLEAFSKLRTRLPDATLRIVGCSPEVSEPNVFVEGFLDKRNPAAVKRLAECYLGASCFCLPTLFDPFPNAIIEAASVGLPCVAIDNGSRREAVVNGKTGYLSTGPNAGELADALYSLLEDPRRCRELGENARHHAAEHFTWDRVVEKIGGAVKGLAQEGAR